MPRIEVLIVLAEEHDINEGKACGNPSLAAKDLLSSKSQSPLSPWDKEE